MQPSLHELSVSVEGRTVLTLRTNKFCNVQDSLFHVTTTTIACSKLILLFLQVTKLRLTEAYISDQEARLAHDRVGL